MKKFVAVILGALIVALGVAKWYRGRGRTQPSPAEADSVELKNVA